MSLKASVVSNFLGQGWRALLSIAFIPVYIRYMGIEAYGLIGVFAVLQAWLALLDMGMRPALNREMARFTGGAHGPQHIRDLLRSIEALALAIAAAMALGIWLASHWLATHWLVAKAVPVDVVSQALALMGVVAALSFVESIYVSSLSGLQRQVLLNALSSSVATVRALGAVAVLVWVSPTIHGFFIWQAIVSMASVGLIAGCVYHVLPAAARRARFSYAALHEVWRFAGGMMAITFLALLLTKVDKILLSRMLTLEAFGFYALASTIAGALYMIITPVTTAYLPRFTEQVAQRNSAQLRGSYHQAAQLVSVVTIPVAVMLILFGDKILLLWTRDHHLAQQVAPLLSILATGTLLNGFMNIPYYTQLAHGWTSLTTAINAVAVAILVPAILLVVPRYGAVGAAWVWVALNMSYLVFNIYFMHLRLLPGEKWQWYRTDVFTPLASSACVALALRWSMPDDLTGVELTLSLALSGGGTFLAAVFGAPLMRRKVADLLREAARGWGAKAWNGLS